MEDVDIERTISGPALDQGQTGDLNCMNSTIYVQKKGDLHFIVKVRNNVLRNKFINSTTGLTTHFAVRFLKSKFCIDMSNTSIAWSHVLNKESFNGHSIGLW